MALQGVQVPGGGIPEFSLHTVGRGENVSLEKGSRGADSDKAWHQTLRDTRFPVLRRSTLMATWRRDTANRRKRALQHLIAIRLEG
jgi:hypothetical protein